MSASRTPARRKTRPLMNILLLSTCGTSILTNGVSDDLRKSLIKYSNVGRSQNDRSLIPPQISSAIENHIATRANEVRAMSEVEVKRASAEMNGIDAILRGYKDLGRVAHVLVHTDTWLGESTAQIVEARLQNQASRESVLLVSAAGLRTDSYENFRLALNELLVSVQDIAGQYREQGYEVVFNLTGGFKSLNGFLQTLGLLAADRCAYLFEGAGEVVYIPRLPIEIAEEPALKVNLEVFRKLMVGLSVTSDEAKSIPETLIDQVGDEIDLSPWGKMVWAKYRFHLLSRGLLPSLSSKLVYTKGLAGDVSKLEAIRQVMVNEKLDRMANYLEKNRTEPVLKSDLFKPVQGKKNAYEVYAWSDQDARRLFGHFEESTGTFVVDKLDKHL